MDETVVQMVQSSSRSRNQLYRTSSRRRNGHGSAVVGVNETVGTSGRMHQRPSSVEIINETLPIVALPLNRNEEPRTIDIIDLCNDSSQTDVPELVNLISPEDTPPTSSHTGTRTKSPYRSPANNNAPSAELMCAICMDNYRNREPTVTKCGHIFCKSCILQSIHNIGAKCPICRRGISSYSLILIHL